MSEKDKNDQMERFGRIAVDFYASQNILHTTLPFFAEVCMSFASDFVRTRHVKVVVSIGHSGALVILFCTVENITFVPPHFINVDIQRSRFKAG